MSAPPQLGRGPTWRIHGRCTAPQGEFELSTLGQPNLQPAWKQEVSRRIAAHKNRKGAPAPETPSQPHPLGGSRAAEAAARVAARYAHAPSYSQMQAEEARVAVRAAEIATRVALEAQAAAESALAQLHAAATELPSRGPAVIESITRAARIEPPAPVAEAAPASTPEPAAQPAAIAAPPAPAEPEPSQTVPSLVDIPAPVYIEQKIDGSSLGIRWEPDTPVRALQSKPANAADDFELSAEDWWTPAQVSATLHHEPIAVDSQQTHANLIEFPRELVATRKMRPRLAEPLAAQAIEGQLSIFEVDPSAIATEPEAPAAGSASAWSSPNWSGPEWSGIELDEHPQPQPVVESDASQSTERIFLAPFGRRLLAMVVDGCLIFAAFFASAMMLAARMQQAPAPRSAQAMVLAGLVLVGLLYNAFFFALRVSTPGMLYAGIALSTFDDESPTRAQLRRRLGAMLLSLLPVGLGLAWAIFDEDHLTWHDRISQTYLRKR